jgi:hypothetical protein
MKKIRVYVKERSKTIQARKPKPFMPQPKPVVAFVLRKIQGMPYDEASREVERLMSILDVTKTDKACIALLMRQRCPKRSQ